MSLHMLLVHRNSSRPYWEYFRIICGGLLRAPCLPKKMPIIIYSDGCLYQNQNVVIANALLNLSIKHKTTIIQKFLEHGHTQMECDLVHSVIELKLSNCVIHLPYDYVTVTKEASASNPYKVIQIDHSFVKNTPIHPLGFTKL
ncbi:unnamed protein product [Parnassius apollo]|uniref:(apollo) hypothetical protein n=1 Tax=Parnassius apollo TaxID=110799 RepID=A0A8S3XID9_PARAO|nr:unnamed protein product [Parnassius apollo]